MSTLYRQYRPQSFAEVFGQNPIKITLSEEIKRGQVASAYLFCGPRAVGKTTIARLLAKSLNCLDRKKDSAEPCNKCASCQAIMAGQSLDIIEIDAASQTGVDNVRENIIASSRIAASGGQYKVFIIDEVHMLSNSSFNALLKTLEEPPKQVVFILCTTEVHKIPATVISRCERYDFKKISPSDMAKKLQHILKQEGWVADEAVLAAIAKNSQGHLRDAESLLGQLLAVSQPTKKDEKKLTMEDFYLLSPSSDLAMIGQFIKALSEQNSLEAISLINKLVADGRDVRVFLQDLVEILRQMLLSKINPQLLPEYQVQWGSDDAFGLAEWREKLAVNRLIQFLQAFLQAYNETKEAFIIQLPVELAVVKVLQPATEPAPRIISRPVTVSAPIADSTPITTPAPTSTPTPTPAPTAPKPGQSELAPAVQSSEPVKPSQPTEPLKVQDISAQWSVALTQIKKQNAGLAVMLKACQPQVNGGQVCLLFRYKFHQDQVNQPGTKHIVEEALSEVLGQPVSFSTKLMADLDVKITPITEQPASDGQTPAVDNSINNLLEIFNGQVIGEA